MNDNTIQPAKTSKDLLSEKEKTTIDLLFLHLKGLINREDLISYIWEKYKNGNYVQAYWELERFITSNKPLVVKAEYSKRTLREEIAREIKVDELPDDLKLFFIPYPKNLQTFFLVATRPFYEFITNNMGDGKISEITKVAIGNSILELNEKLTPQANNQTLYQLFQTLYETVNQNFNQKEAENLLRQSYSLVAHKYGIEWLPSYFEFLPKGLLTTERLGYLSKTELEQKVSEAIKSEQEKLITIQKLYDDTKIKTAQIERQNLELENTKKAMLNILEDEKELDNKLKMEKASVEAKVLERTKELKVANEETNRGWFQVREEKAKLTASIEALLKGFIMIDLKGDILLTNKNVDELFGAPNGKWTLVKLQERLGKTFDLITNYRNCLVNKKKEIFDGLVWGSRYLQIRLSPVFEINMDTMIGVLVIIGDVTEEKALQRSRDEFFSIASHELRTPLTAIRGNTSLIEEYFGDKIKDPEVKEMIADIHESSTRLINIVNDFLNMSRLEMGKMKIERETFDIVPICEKTVEELLPGALTKGIKLSLNAGDRQIPQVIADKTKFKEVLVNLVGNAIKFTENGGVEIVLSPYSSGLKISVSDTGRGISPQYQSLLFRKFQQAGSSLYTRDTTKGTGLGLYISRLMVEAMGGRIWLEKSIEGQGSIFSFTLPVAS